MDFESIRIVECNSVDNRDWNRRLECKQTGRTDGMYMRACYVILGCFPSLVYAFGSAGCNRVIVPIFGLFPSLLPDTTHIVHSFKYG